MSTTATIQPRITLHHDDNGWHVSMSVRGEKPASFGPYRTRDEAKEVADRLKEYLGSKNHPESN